MVEGEDPWFTQFKADLRQAAVENGVCPDCGNQDLAEMENGNHYCYLCGWDEDYEN